MRRRVATSSALPATNNMVIGHTGVEEPVAGRPETTTVVAGEIVDEGTVVADSYSFNGGDVVVVVVGSGVLIEAIHQWLPKSL
jgi:hypothetical protein